MKLFDNNEQNSVDIEPNQPFEKNKNISIFLFEKKTLKKNKPLQTKKKKKKLNPSCRKKKPPKKKSKHQAKKTCKTLKNPLQKKMKKKTLKKMPNPNISLSNTSNRHLKPSSSPHPRRPRKPGKITNSTLNPPTLRVSSSRPDHRMQRSTSQSIIIKRRPGHCDEEAMKLTHQWIPAHATLLTSLLASEIE